ncbi:MAG: UDP-N-acetylglucosamine 2-epimerase (non-hydrolyzing) [Defluviitaleaceae bacterium]|nr:UDP-N-acetylglucosamine 2-epimerase (non-hydrolyzing) [Defluviitaleaceae bacterium]
MDRIKVLSIFGTRPEATKMAPVINELRTRPDEFESVVCVTAQHRQMLDQVLQVFNIIPDYDLNIMQAGQSLTDIVTRCLNGLGDVIARVRPDIMLVHGDTSTTFAGSLSAFYGGVKLGHVEAGLRTYDKYQPYPEEMNRRLTAALADYHFAPTSVSRENLLKENISDEKIFVTGNTAVDCLKTTVFAGYVFAEPKLRGIDYSKKRVIVMTAHRRENIGENLDNILKAIRQIADDYEDVLFVYPVHRNPAILKQVEETLGSHPGVITTEPVNMNDMHNLINLSYMALTDSGGIQEEAPGLNKPVIVLRNVTERPEGLTAGTLLLAGTKRESVYESVKFLLDDKSAYDRMAAAKNPFGDGFAAARIADAINHVFGSSQQRPADYSWEND